MQQRPRLQAPTSKCTGTNGFHKRITHDLTAFLYQCGNVVFVWTNISTKFVHHQNPCTSLTNTAQTRDQPQQPQATPGHAERHPVTRTSRPLNPPAGDIYCWAVPKRSLVVSHPLWRRGLVGGGSSDRHAHVHQEENSPKINIHACQVIQVFEELEKAEVWCTEGIRRGPPFVM